MWWTLIVWGFFSLVDFDCEDCKKVTDNVIHTTDWLLTYNDVSIDRNKRKVSSKINRDKKHNARINDRL